MTKHQLRALLKILDRAIDRLTDVRDTLPDDDEFRTTLANAIDGLHPAHAMTLAKLSPGTFAPDDDERLTGRWMR